MTTLVLARHGRTAYNARRIIQGPWIDAPLDRVGREQARRLAERLGAEPPVEVLASPLRRAVETAEPLARMHDLPLYEDERLLEIDWGDWNGARKDRATMARLAALAERWQAGDAEARPPGGESAAEALERVLAAVGESTDRVRGGSALLVAHGRVNKILLSWLVHGDLAHQEEFPASNAAVTVLRRAGERWETQALDCRRHLLPARRAALLGLDPLALIRRRPAGTQSS